MTKMMYGVGIMDAEYKVTQHVELPKVNGKRNQKMVWKCPYYARWVDMLKRCYCPKYLAKYPTYHGVTVCNEWLTFSNFREWLVESGWNMKDSIDKDFLQGSEGKIYSPETCVFISSGLNNFMLKGGRSGHGVTVRQKASGIKYEARCSDPFKENKPSLGLFDTFEEAHLAWRACKHKYACRLAESGQVTDERVKQVLRTKYLTHEDSKLFEN